jgi:dTDP-4-amino-4,6-dideoxygalactose transaminase
MHQIPFSRVSLGGNELKYLTEVLNSGWLTTSGKAFAFEKLFAEKIGVKYACAVNSCTAALHLALEAVGIGKGDQVVVPAMTFTATSEVVRYLQADPIFTDVEYGTSMISSEILLNTLNKSDRIKAVVPVHYGGQSLELTNDKGEGIYEICKKINIPVIEDAAHAFPTKLNNRFVGSIGDATCFSFYANKTITTGEGGMLTTNSEWIYNRVKLMRLHGINKDVWNRFTNGKTNWEYEVVAPGYKYNISDLNAAVGLAQLERADYFREQRQRCAKFYMNELNDIDVLDLPVIKGPSENHSWHLFPVIVKPCSPVSRNRFIEIMADHGIGTSVHYKPLYRMSYYRDRYGLNENDFPNAEKIWKGTVSLPIYPCLSNSELKYICKIIRKILKPYKYIFSDSEPVVDEKVY